MKNNILIVEALDNIIKTIIKPIEKTEEIEES